jgi:hypothetical protein
MRRNIHLVAARFGCSRGSAVDSCSADRYRGRVRGLLQLIAAVVVIAAIAPGRARAEAVEPNVWIGGGLGLSPVGTLKSGIQDESNSFDASTALGINGLVEFRVAPNIAIGFAPTLLFNVKSGEDRDSANILDLPVRVAVGGQVAPTIRLYGFASPGFSIGFMPDTPPVDLGHPSGFLLGFGGGAGVRVAPGVVVTTELGYQFRWLSGTGSATAGNTEVSVDYDFDANYLTFAVGVAVGL